VLLQEILARLESAPPDQLGPVLMESADALLLSGLAEVGLAAADAAYADELAPV
jgi:hypothetical protein